MTLACTVCNYSERIITFDYTEGNVFISVCLFMCLLMWFFARSLSKSTRCDSSDQIRPRNPCFKLTSDHAQTGKAQRTQIFGTPLIRSYRLTYSEEIWLSMGSTILQPKGSAPQESNCLPLIHVRPIWSRSVNFGGVIHSATISFKGRWRPTQLRGMVPAPPPNFSDHHDTCPYHLT